MSSKKYHVSLTQEEREELTQLTSRGKVSARKLNHAKILLHADEVSGNSIKDVEIAKALHVSVSSVERVRKRFVEEGLDSALNPKVQTRRRAKKIDGEAEAFLIATACSEAPGGRASWTMKLLADKLVECGFVDSISGECVRQALKKTNLNLG